MTARWSCAPMVVLLLAVCAPMATEARGEIRRAKVATAQTSNRTPIIGLLTLPQLLGDVDCLPPEPSVKEIPLYAQPRAADIVGWIRAEKHPLSYSECYSLALKFHRKSDGSATELPVEEYEYERPFAAVVIEARGRWFKLSLGNGAAWMNASGREKYFPLEDLVGSHPAYLTNAWDGTLAAAPGGAGRRPPADPRRRVIGYVEPLFDLGRGIAADAFERPDRSAKVVAWLRTDSVDASLRMTSSRVAVFARRPGWLQVALRRDDWKDEPRVWIEDARPWRFHPLTAAAEREAFEEDVFGREHQDVYVLDSRTVGGRLWLFVQVLSHRADHEDEPLQVVAAGWVPAHGREGEPVVWFSTRD